MDVLHTLNRQKIKNKNCKKKGVLGTSEVQVNEK